MIEHQFPRYNGVPRVTSTDQPSKQEAFLTFLEDGWVTIYVDARHPDVVVPPHLKGESRLVLQYGLNMPVPVENLQVTDVGVKATLSFSRQPHDTLIPWPAIYVIACTDGRGLLYKEDVPAELMAEVSGEEQGRSEDDKPPKPVSPAPQAASAGRGAAAQARTVQSSDEEGDEPPVEKTKPRQRLKSIPMPDADEPRSQENLAADEALDSQTPKPPEDDPPAGGGRPKLRLVK